MIGFMIELTGLKGGGSAFLDKTLSRVSEISKPGTGINITPPPFDGLVRFVRQSSFYRYSGSLTTPPCSEPVNWFVGTKKLLLEVGTYTALKRVVKFNSRFTQSAPGEVNVLQAACAH